MVKANERTQIENLYNLYGFSMAERGENYLIFTYNDNGYFANAEMVLFDHSIDNYEQKRKEYEETGFVLRMIDYTSYHDMWSHLFRGFFGIERVNKRLRNDYSNFCKLQEKKLLDSKYEYVQPTSLWDNREIHEDLIGKMVNQLNQPGAQLIILEAAAGFGKTCTSYELINRLSSMEHNYAPILTELSKNRKAAVFRYVLLDEIDKKFTSLSSNVVLSEIRNGNVLLIIDGFDELISRSNKNMAMQNSDAQDEENAQTMLDTIAEMFGGESKTKIVLTSRKSAIFTDDAFQEWASDHLNACTVTRISIEVPTVRDWLGYEKIDYLEKKTIPFSSFVNPILLAFMRSMSLDAFKSQCSSAENVIKYYFDSLLERERERQLLNLTVQEQYGVLKKLADFFIQMDIASEELSFIKDLFVEIIHKDFAEYQSRYLSVEERPSEDEFATKLAGHALLNRISPYKNEIGFINEFIFGIFIGDIIIENSSRIEDMDFKYIDFACTAFACRSNEKKEALFDVVEKVTSNMNYGQRLDIELKLNSTIKSDYSNHFIANRIFGSEICFDGSFVFNKCTFSGCTFKDCALVTSSFNECNFFNCKFYDVIVLRDTESNCHLSFSDNCFGQEQFAKEASYEAPISTDDGNVEDIILRRFWGSGDRYSRGRLSEAYVLKKMTSENTREYKEALENLRKSELLVKDGHSWYLNKENIKKIKERLGIGH